MKTAITRLALMQLAALAYAILFTAAFCKIGGVVVENGGFTPPLDMCGRPCSEMQVGYWRF